MSTVATVVDDVRMLLRSVKPAEAEARLSGLISSLNDQDLCSDESTLRNSITDFLPKRQARLNALLESRLGPLSPIPPQALRSFLDDLHARLDHLSSHHIFQWSTDYRDTISWVYDELLDLAERASNPQALTAIVETELREHALQIYAKGYQFQIGRRDSSLAQEKSVSGLQKFLALPIEAYSARLPGAIGGSRPLVLRLLTSSALQAILSGYGAVAFGRQTGWQHLPRVPRAWAHYLAFLCASDADRLVADIEPGDFRDGLLQSVVPLLAAIDQLVGQPDLPTCPLPTIGQFDWSRRRLDVSLSLPKTAERKQYLDVQCFLDQSYLARLDLEQAYSRGIDVVIGPFRPDLAEWVKGHDHLRSATVDTSSLTSPDVKQRTADILGFLVARASATVVDSTPLTFNFARDFPLKNPFVTRFFRVFRTSVRDLLRLYEGKNGVRLWCSVRRSGKTTACFDLGSSSADSVIVNQTCDHTDQFPGADTFYSAVSEALIGGEPIPKTFVADTVAACIDNRDTTPSRLMFVLDEYETLFERLGAAATRDRELRYTVVQPLLNQIVAFSRGNLVVLIGQRPDAHYIIMDQNQLSPYIEQDHFPLFPHASGDISSEFRELVRKVLTDRVLVDDSFLDCLHKETAGHPYLAVNLLVDLCDWMIATKRPARALQLVGSDYSCFATDRLNDGALLRSPEYDFFRKVVGESLASSSQQQCPWLHFVYSLIRRIAQESPSEMTCAATQVEEMAGALNTERYGYSAQEIVRTATMANFLFISEDQVRPRIPLLGRLCRLTVPRER